MKDNCYKIIIVLILYTTVFSISIFAQSGDDSAYKKINEIENVSKKITALKKFLAEYPQSSYSMNARYQIFTGYLDENNTDSALVYAYLMVKPVPSMARFNLYNNIAYELAKKKTGLDTAAVYAKRAVNAVRNAGMNNLGMYLDTQALVFYDLGKVDSALALEKEAIIGHEDDPAYLNSLSIYLNAAGQKKEAILTAGKAILYGNTYDAPVNLKKWVKAEVRGKIQQTELKQKTANEIIKDYQSKLKADEKVKGKSQAAAFLATLGVYLPKANKLAKEALSVKNLSVENRVAFTINYAMVLEAEGKANKAIKELNSVKNIADPWNGDFWYTLGKIYEKTGNTKKAIDAYISGSVAYKIPKVTNALNELAGKIGLTENEINTKIENKKNELTSFNPGHYKSSSKGKVVLAELFTGAECPPCAAADYAFDALSEYYPRSMFVILEYHEHIPAPDPMTNPSSFGRYLYYGGNFGTPTAIIQGQDRITGGGPKFLAINRFNVYKFMAKKYFDEKPVVTITGTVQNKMKLVKVKLEIKENKGINNNANLHVALVEKSINYPGGNGVTKNIFVVRDLFNNANGSPLNFKNGLDEFNVTFNLKKIENDLVNYLNAPEKYPSWRQGVPFTGWRQKPDKLNKNNLAVVAWVQNNQNKEVLQTLYLNVPKAN